MSRAIKRDSNCDLPGWEDGVIFEGPPAANPARLGKDALTFAAEDERRRKEHARQLAAHIADNPALLDEEIVQPTKRRGRVKGSKNGQVKHEQ